MLFCCRSNVGLLHKTIVTRIKIPSPPCVRMSARTLLISNSGLNSKKLCCPGIDQLGPRMCKSWQLCITQLNSALEARQGLDLGLALKRLNSRARPLAAIAVAHERCKSRKLAKKSLRQLSFTDTLRGFCSMFWAILVEYGLIYQYFKGCAAGGAAPPFALARPPLYGFIFQLKPPPLSSPPPQGLQELKSGEGGPLPHLRRRLNIPLQPLLKMHHTEICLQLSCLKRRNSRKLARQSLVGSYVRELLRLALGMTYKT